MSDPVFAREPLVTMLESGLEDLLRAHWKEVALDQDIIPYKPDWLEYFAQEMAGKIITWSLRRDGVLIGYTAFHVVRSLHYSVPFAMNDVVYLKPDERGIEGIAMIVLAERALAELGVVKAFYHVKTDFLLGAGDTADSLEGLEQLADLESRLGVEFPEAVFSGDRTLGGVLAALGYGHVENHFGKLLNGKVK